MYTSARTKSAPRDGSRISLWWADSCKDHKDVRPEGARKPEAANYLFESRRDQQMPETVAAPPLPPKPKNKYRRNRRDDFSRERRASQLKNKRTSELKSPYRHSSTSSATSDRRVGRNTRSHTVACLHDAELESLRRQMRDMPDTMTPSPSPDLCCMSATGLFSCFKGEQSIESANIKKIEKNLKKINLIHQLSASQQEVEKEITTFLLQNNDFVDNFILQHVSKIKLERLIKAKSVTYPVNIESSQSEHIYTEVTKEPAWGSPGGKKAARAASPRRKLPNPYSFGSRRSLAELNAIAPDGAHSSTRCREDQVICTPKDTVYDEILLFPKPSFSKNPKGRSKAISRSVEIDRRRLSEERDICPTCWPAAGCQCRAIVERSPRRASEPHPAPNDNVDHNEIFLDLVKKLNQEPSERQVVWELASSLDATLRSDAFRLYKILPGHPGCCLVFGLNHKGTGMHESMNKVDDLCRKLINRIAVEGKCKRLARIVDNALLPYIPYELLKFFDAANAVALRHIIFIPIFNIKGETIYVVEMWRKSQFRDYEQEIASTIISWGSLTLHYSSVVTHRIRENNMSDFLINVAKAIFNDLVDLEMLIKRILEFAQRLVSADRASLFLIDYKNNELVSTVFDLKIDEGVHRDTDISRKEIRMPISKGIAGYVATSGETVNINDAYADERFNREVDETTGYKTKSILCMPIKVEGRITSVVQMVNKRLTQQLEEPFSREDELNFEVFSTFFGLALQRARLYDRIRCNEQKYKVALEVLGYHNTSNEDDVQMLLSDKKDISVDLDNFYLNPFVFDPDDKCKTILIMFDDLFSMSNYDYATLTRFVLTVRKNYRNVPYHNFNHGWSVAHSMYMMLKNNTSKQLDTNARLALFVAALCHDLDHRGFTNKFMIDSNTPLAAMYSTATLEHHHFNITVTLLHQKGHNFLAHVGKDDFRTILNYIKQCILATDLASFFPNLTKLKSVFGEENLMQLDWGNMQHRELAMALSMTAADLSASTKPWDIQIKTVEVIFEEFYRQGDIEKEAGRKPIPTMDRTKPKQQSPSQVDFLSHICVPCYEMLAKIMPETKPMLMQAKMNFERWQAKAEDSSKADSSITQEGSITDSSASDCFKTNAARALSPERDTFTWDAEQGDIIALSNSNSNIKPNRKNSEAFSWLESDEVNLRRNSK